MRYLRISGLAPSRRFGGHGGGETPGPIPNPEVKPSRADGTARATGWESRSLPEHLRTSRPPRAARSRCSTTLSVHMAKPLRPRPSGKSRPRATSAATLPRDLADEVRRTARVADQKEGMARLARAIERLDRSDPAGAPREAATAKRSAPRSGSRRGV